jgi:hypothetical protein
MEMSGQLHTVATVPPEIKYSGHYRKEKNPLAPVGNRTRLPFFFNLCGGTLGTAATTGLLYQPRMRGDGDCGEIGRMKIGRGNRSTQRKSTPVPLCPPQIPHA